MNIAVVDDQIRETAGLCDILTEYASSANLPVTVDRFESGEEFLAGYRPYLYSVIFLDIYMSGISGIETARSIRESDAEAHIIFLTSSMDHMGEAFSVHAFHYLLKQSGEEFRKTVVELMDDVLKSRHSNSPVLGFLWGKKEYRISYNDLIYIKSNNHNLEIMDSHENAYFPRITYKDVYKKLSSDGRFLQINRGILVNIDKIESFSPASDPNICRLKGDYCFPINLRERKAINAIRQNYIFRKMHNKT